VKFKVAQDVFEHLNNVCFGVVWARGVNNRDPNPEIGSLLESSIEELARRLATGKAKTAPEIVCYREAFNALGMNPNKFPSSIEAMASRIEKGKGFPHINPVVDLGNAISLKYLIPLGAHDTDSARGDIQVRFSRAGDRFIPFGETAEEILEPGELIYSVGERVKTRRWIWRQSEQGKVTEASSNIFFPLDGFVDMNYHSLISARDELADRLHRLLGAAVGVGFIDRNQTEIELF